MNLEVFVSVWALASSCRGVRRNGNRKVVIALVGLARYVVDRGKSLDWNCQSRFSRHQDDLVGGI